MVNKENVVVKFVFSEGTSEVVWLLWEIFSSEFKWITHSNGIKTSLSSISCHIDHHTDRYSTENNIEMKCLLIN